LTPEIWSIEAGHLTPTMKVKRKIVQEKYQSLVDEIYS
jgi:long-chain acyl-CoA synthetase